MQSFLLQDRIQAGCGVGEPDEFATEVDAFEEGGKDTALGNDAGQDDAVGFLSGFADGWDLEGGIGTFVVDRV